MFLYIIKEIEDPSSIRQSVNLRGFAHEFSEKIFLQHRQAAYQPNCNFNFRQRACHRVRNGAV